jgi:hypothetical protein
MNDYSRHGPRTRPDRPQRVLDGAGAGGAVGPRAGLAGALDRQPRQAATAPLRRTAPIPYDPSRGRQHVIAVPPGGVGGSAQSFLGWFKGGESVSKTIEVWRIGDVAPHALPPGIHVTLVVHTESGEFSDSGSHACPSTSREVGVLAFCQRDAATRRGRGLLFVGSTSAPHRVAPVGSPDRATRGRGHTIG